MGDFDNDKPLVESSESDDSFSSDDGSDTSDSFGSSSEESDSFGSSSEESDSFEGNEKETNPVSSNDDLDWNYENSDPKDDEPEKLSFDSSEPMTKVSVDWIELEGALENNSPELHSFICKETGDVIRVFRGSEDADTRLRSIEADPNFVYVEPISSREQYRWMEDFIEGSEESNLKDKLNIAIDGKTIIRFR